MSSEDVLETGKNTDSLRIGEGKPGPGRPKGSETKATKQVRNAIAAFIENNAEKVQTLWDRVAIDAPDKALDLYGKLAEYVLPKLARTELSGDIGVKGSLILEDPNAPEKAKPAPVIEDP